MVVCWLGWLCTEVDGVSVWLCWCERCVCGFVSLQSMVELRLACVLGWVFEEVVDWACWGVLPCSGVHNDVGSGCADKAGFCGALGCVVVSCVVLFCVWGEGLCGFCNHCGIACFSGVVISLGVPLVGSVFGVGVGVGGCGCGCV